MTFVAISAFRVKSIFFRVFIAEIKAKSDKPDLLVHFFYWKPNEYSIKASRKHSGFTRDGEAASSNLTGVSALCP